MDTNLINDSKKTNKKNDGNYQKWLNPTVFIGLGGFGCNVVRTIKKISSRYLSSDLMKALGFIGLDTHPFDPHDILTRAEYVGLSVGAVPNILARSHPDTLNWYLELTKKWSAPNIEGANMVRAVGRLSFLNPPAHETFMNLLIKKHDQVSQFPGANNFIIYIISSLAGGSGSGMLLDVFISVREYFQDIRGGQAIIQAFLATPDPLENEAPPINLPNFYANTYATLKEMYYFLEGNTFSLDYKTQQFQRVTAERAHLPNAIFIVSNGNQDDMKIVDRFEKLGHSIANYLLLEILTPLNKLQGAPQINRGENAFMDIMGPNNMLKAFSSIGVAKFGFPYEEVIDYFNYSIIDYYLDKELSFDKMFVKKKSQQWIIDSGISEFQSDDLQLNLRKSDQGEIFNVYLSLENEFEDIKRQKLMGKASDLVTSKEQFVKKQLEEILNENYEKLLNNVTDAFHNSLNNLINSYSIGTSYRYILSCSDEIKIHYNALLEELDQSKRAFQNSKEKVKMAIGNIGTAAESGWFGRKDRIKAAISSFESELQNYLNIIVKLMAQEKGIQFYKKILEMLEEEQKRYHTLIQSLTARNSYVENKFYNLRNTLEMLSNKFERKLGNRFSFAQIGHINRIFEERFTQEVLGTISNKLKQALRKNGLLMNQIIQDEKWVSEVSSFSKPEIASSISDLNMIDLLQKFYPTDEEQSELFAFLVSICSPLFPINPSLREQYQTVWIIASDSNIRDQFLKIFKPHIDPNDGVQLALSKEKFEITIYTIRHGYTIHSNSRISIYKSNYDNLQSRYQLGLKKRLAIPPVHSWPEAWLWNEVIPSIEGQEGNLYFILGRAFTFIFDEITKGQTKIKRNNVEFIYARGRFYYMRDQNNREVRLGDGLIEAVETFQERADLMDIIKDRIEEKMQVVGAQNIKSKLIEYSNLLFDEINKASGERLEILEKLRGTLDSYIKSLETSIV